MFANNKVINFAGSGFISFSRDVEIKGKPRGSLTCATINTNIPLINRMVAQFFDVYLLEVARLPYFLMGSTAASTITRNRKKIERDKTKGCALVSVSAQTVLGRR